MDNLGKNYHALSLADDHCYTGLENSAETRMTIFAGVFSLDRKRDVPAVVSDDLRKVISRAPGDSPEIRVLNGCTVGFQSLEMLPGSGVFADERGAYTLLYGDPLVTPRQTGTRHDDLRSIHVAWKENDDSLLRRARGSFCVVQIDPIAAEYVWRPTNSVSVRCM